MFKRFVHKPHVGQKSSKFRFELIIHSLEVSEVDKFDKKLPYFGITWTRGPRAAQTTYVLPVRNSHTDNKAQYIWGPQELQLLSTIYQDPKSKTPRQFSPKLCKISVKQSSQKSPGAGGKAGKQKRIGYVEVDLAECIDEANPKSSEFRLALKYCNSKSATLRFTLESYPLSPSPAPSQVPPASQQSTFPASSESTQASLVDEIATASFTSNLGNLGGLSSSNNLLDEVNAHREQAVRLRATAQNPHSTSCVLFSFDCLLPRLRGPVALAST